MGNEKGEYSVNFTISLKLGNPPPNLCSPGTRNIQLYQLLLFYISYSEMVKIS